jgi:hypothetical protein
VAKDACNNQQPLREACVSLIAASEQIALALRESRPQVDALGAALQKLAAALPAHNPAGDATTLRGEMLRAVTRLQFYDRMTQHLTHVQDYLARSAQQLETQAKQSPPATGWSGVHQQLSDSLLTETQRFHLDKSFQQKLEPGAVDRTRKAGTSAPGDIDLF